MREMFKPVEPEFADSHFLGSKTAGLRFSERLNTRPYNVLADPEPNRAKQNNSKIAAKAFGSSPSPGPPGHPDLAAIWRLKRLTLLNYCRKGKLC